jgi:type IX secretion system PorP/SprF family membrane protein
MRYSRYVALLCLVVALQSQAQDISNFSQFFLNPYMLNPSYVGIEGRSAFFLAYRKQWTTIQGAPVLANLSYHTPLSKRLSLGLNLNSDKRGITNTSSVLLTFGYMVPIDKETFVRFGLSAGYAYNSIDWEKVGTFTDPALSNLLTKTSTLLGNAGVSFHKKTFHVGIALPNIFQPIYLSNESFTVTALKPFQSVVVHASNRFYFNKDKNVFEPYLIYRLNNGLPSQLEAATVVHLQHAVWVGASYKQQFGISGLLGFKIQNLFAIGFSYSIQNSGVNQLAAPSYEVQLGFLGGKKKKEVSYYSFVDTHKEKPPKKTAAQLAAERKKEQELKAQKLAEDKKNKEDQLAEEKAAKKQKTDSLQEVARKKVEADSLAQKAVADQKQLREVNQDTLAHHADRHEFVKRGDNNEDLAVGNYVVVGVFQSRANAESFVKGLKRMSVSAQFGFLTDKSYWYVYLFQSDDINTVRAERDKNRKLIMFKDAWLLTVQP